MKNRIIKFLGGTTQSETLAILEEMSELKKTISKMKRDMYKAGDLVYITDPKFSQTHQYFLLEPYNNGYCWHVSTDATDRTRNEMVNGVRTEDISYESPQVCSSCGQVLK